MVWLIIIALILISVTWYIVRAHQALKNQWMPVIEEENRPSVQRDFFMEGLVWWTITHPQIVPVVDLLAQYIYWDKQLIHALIISLLSWWHIIVQWHPGTGKTTLVRLLSRICDFSYARIQCTPDLLPQDVIGTEIFDNKTQQFILHTWPLVAHIVHVDEINRATPKLQAAFLEAMQEQAMTIWNQRIELPDPFFVIATQNPYDSIGTYMLPYAQVDRFMIWAYTNPLLPSDEYRLLQQPEHQTLSISLPPVAHMLHVDTILQLQQEIKNIVIPDETLHHVLSCVHTVKAYNIEISARASKSIIIAAKTWAYIQGKQAIEKTDIDAVLSSVLRHRVSHLLWKDIDLETLYRIITWVAQKDDIVV